MREKLRPPVGESKHICAFNKELLHNNTTYVELNLKNIAKIHNDVLTMLQQRCILFSTIVGGKKNVFNYKRCCKYDEGF